MTSVAEITQRILQQCRDMGFALAGVCDAQPTEHAEELRSWIDSGMHGEMGYLERHLELRLDPEKFVPGAKSVICVADRYAGETSKHQSVDTNKLDQAVGKIARYARGKDYHRVMRDRLGKLSLAFAKDFPDHRFRSCVDTAPILEREYAQRAGLGAIGKNTMLLERSVGSWLLLGEIVTTMPLAFSRPADPDPCGSCTRCIDACPTHAIAREGWSLDATRCISYLTIEHRSLIDEEFHEALGDWVFGCDICQEVCPHNQPKSQNADLPTHPAYAPQRASFDLLEVLNWTEADRAQAMVNSSMKRARLDMMKRNAIIAAGNAARQGIAAVVLLNRIKRIIADESETAMVRTTAERVVARIDRRSHLP